MAHQSFARAPISAAAKRDIRAPEQLVQNGLITAESLAGVRRVCDEFSLAITTEMAELINSEDAADPIARQFVPQTTELSTTPDELKDPIGDDPYTPVKGIVHRYPDRVLLKPVHVCPIYCRFCFRREKVGAGGDGNLSNGELAAALDYVRNNADIWEVILTGGDPLVLPPHRLKNLVARLAAISHVKVIRVHTRLPVAAPERVTAALVRALRSAKATFVVLHANHPRELTPQVRTACARFIDAGIPMLSQSVLLREVNDDVETLGALMRALVESRIKPYYLHHADLAPGTAHWRTSIVQGQSVMRALRGRYSGLCQPAYVLDIPGGYGKSPIGPTYLSADGSSVEDFNGRRHAYPG